jgi:two-component system, OmpR family, response regulator
VCLVDNERTRDLRILCVDDDPDIRLIVELALHLDPEMRVRSVAGAAEALAVLREEAFDLVILDALMPEVNGLELLERIPRIDGSPPMPIIFLTADALRRARYDKAGVIGVIIKPFDPLRLADTVRSLVTNVGTTRIVGY